MDTSGLETWARADFQSEWVSDWVWFNVPPDTISDFGDNSYRIADPAQPGTGSGIWRVFSRFVYLADDPLAQIGIKNSDDVDDDDSSDDDGGSSVVE